MWSRFKRKCHYRVTSMLAAITQCPDLSRAAAVLVVLATAHIVGTGGGSSVTVFGEAAGGRVMFAGNVVAVRPTIVCIVVSFAGRAVSAAVSVSTATRRSGSSAELGNFSSE